MPRWFTLKAPGPTRSTASITKCAKSSDGIQSRRSGGSRNACSRYSQRSCSSCDSKGKSNPKSDRLLACQTAAGICTGAQKCTTGSVVACPRSPWEGPARGATRPPHGWRRPRAWGGACGAHAGKRGRVPQRGVGALAASGTSATFGRGWPGSVSASTRTRPASWSLGRFAVKNRRQRGVGKPETFDFLGFTHYCTTTRRGRFRLGRKPVAKRVNRTLARIDEVLRKRWHHDIWEVGKWLGRVLRRLPQLLCRPGVGPVHPCVPPQAATPVDAGATPAVPASPIQLEATGAHNRNPVVTRLHPPPMAGPAVCRQSPEVGAGWFNDHVRICAGGAQQYAFLPQLSASQDRVDDAGEPVQLGPPDRLRPTVARRGRIAQHLLHRATVDAEPPARLVMAQTLVDNRPVEPPHRAPRRTSPAPRHNRKGTMSGAILRRRDRTVRSLRVEHYSSAVNTSPFES